MDGVNPKIGRVKALIARVPFHQNEMMGALSFFDFRQCGDFAEIFALCSADRAFCTSGITGAIAQRQFGCTGTSPFGQSSVRSIGLASAFASQSSQASSSAIHSICSTPFSA